MECLVNLCDKIKENEYSCEHDVQKSAFKIEALLPLRREDRK